MTQPRPRALAALAAAALLLSGCAPAANGQEDDAPSTLRWAFSLPTSWDPVTSSTGNDINTLSLVYASLTQLDEEGNAGPGLAESWDYSPDGTEVTFHLRPELTFTDGTALDAEAVKESLERGKEQENSLLKDQLATIESITADSELDVTLHLAGVDYQVPNLLAGKTGAIVSPTAAEGDPDALPTAPVGAGPFEFESFVPESNAVLVKNEGYWNADEIHIDRFELSVAPDPATVVAAIQSGSIDVASVPATQIAEAEAAGLEVQVYGTLGVSQVDVHNGLAPFDNPTVVEALKYAIDRQEIVDVLTDGQGTVTYQPFPPGYVAYNPELDDRYAYDPAKAKALLADAGYDESNPLTFEITAGGANEAQAQLVQAQLAKIGVNATISLVAAGSSTWQKEVYLGRNAEFALDGTVGRESPVQNLTVVYGPQGLMNTSRTSSPEFLAALDEVRATPLDDPDYASVLQAAVKLGVEQASSFSTYTSPRVIVRGAGVSALPEFISQVRWEGVTVD
jgi:peptide/nickel transport system substrate-binding protein